MAGRSKKTSSGKKKVSQNPPKFVVTPASPAITHASGKKPRDSDDSTASVAAVVQPATPAPPPSSVSSIGDLEKRFDSRMAQMETSFRSALSEASMGASITHTSAPLASIQEVPPAPPVEKADDSRQKASLDHPDHTSSHHRHHHRRHHRRSSSSPHGHRRRHSRRRSSSGSSRSSSSSSSSSSSGSSRSSSSDSDYSSSRHRHSRRKHHSCRRTRSRSKSKKSKYDTSKYLREGKKLNSYERLVLANARMALSLYKKKRDIRFFGAYYSSSRKSGWPFIC